MIEIPESLTLAGQLNEVLKGRKVVDVTAWQSPHKLAFINGDPATYGNLFSTYSEALSRDWWRVWNSW